MEGTGQTVVLKSPVLYEIDFEKVNTLEDVKDILKGLDLIFSTGYKNLDKIEHLLKRVQ